MASNWSLLWKSHFTRHVFHRKPMRAYRWPQNLTNILVRADSEIKHEPTNVHNKGQKNFFLNNAPVSTHKSKQTSITQFFTQWVIDSSTSLTNVPTRANTCTHHSRSFTAFPTLRTRTPCTNSKCQFFSHLITGCKYSCKHNISCKSSNLIYCISCKTCQKQYIGQTKNANSTEIQLTHFKHQTQQQKTDEVGLHFSLEA